MGSTPVPPPMPFSSKPTISAPGGVTDTARAAAAGAAAHAQRLRATGEGLGPWYAAVHPGVLRLCRGFLASRTSAEDVAQDVMLKLHDALPQWDPTRPFGAWCRSAVLNHCRNQMRSEARRRVHEENAGRGWALAHAPSPETLAESGELSSRIDEALEILPPREREVFVLVDLEGLSSVDAAATLEVAASTVRASLSMARRRLREALTVAETDAEDPR